MPKVSFRIQELVNIAPGPYDYVWDLCCDHGFIGEQFLKSNNIPKEIIFIDRVQSIISSLENRLVTTDIPKGVRLNFIAKSATEVNYEKTKKNLFIIAGIGGVLSIEILKQILKTQSNLLSSTFIVSAHENIPQLREYIQSTKLRLLDEKLIKDNGKYYEILVLSSSGSKEVEICGNIMWQNPQKYHLDYITDKLKYFRLKNSYENSEKLTHIINELDKRHETLAKTL